MSPPIQPARLLDLSFDKIRDLLVVAISDNVFYQHDEETQVKWSTLQVRDSRGSHPYAKKNQRKAINAPSRGFGFLELCLYGIRELAWEQYELNQ